MKISAINYQQNFKGLFIDKSKENGGEWKVVYRPYSWELLPTGNYGEFCDVKKPIMFNKEKIDLDSSRLPWNEEIYIPETKTEPRISKDILGTVSYYSYPSYTGKEETKDYIEVGESLNREESLKVYAEKMKKFMEMKLEKLYNTKEPVWADKKIQSRNNYSGIPNKDVFYYYGAKEAEDLSKYSATLHSEINEQLLESSIFVSKQDKVRNIRTKQSYYDDAVEDYVKKTQEYMNDIHHYFMFKEQTKKIASYISELEEEVKTIQEARLNNKLIDISNRGCADPNKSLWEFLKDFSEEQIIKLSQESEMLISGPHKTTSLKKVLADAIALINWKPTSPSCYTPPFESYKRRFTDKIIDCVDYAIAHKRL